MEREENGNRDRRLADLAFPGGSRHQDQTAVAGLESLRRDGARLRIDQRTRTLVLDLDRPRKFRARFGVGRRRQFREIRGGREIELVGIVFNRSEAEVIAVSNRREIVGILVDGQFEGGFRLAFQVGSLDGNVIHPHRDRMSLGGRNIARHRIDRNLALNSGGNVAQREGHLVADETGLLGNLELSALNRHSILIAKLIGFDRSYELDHAQRIGAVEIGRAETVLHREVERIGGIDGQFAAGIDRDDTRSRINLDFVGRIGSLGRNHLFDSPHDLVGRTLQRRRRTLESHVVFHTPRSRRIAHLQRLAGDACRQQILIGRRTRIGFDLDRQRITARHHLAREFSVICHNAVFGDGEVFETLRLNERIVQNRHRLAHRRHRDRSFGGLQFGIGNHERRLAHLDRIGRGGNHPHHEDILEAVGAAAGLTRNRQFVGTGIEGIRIRDADHAGIGTDREALGREGLVVERDARNREVGRRGAVVGRGARHEIHRRTDVHDRRIEELQVAALGIVVFAGREHDRAKGGQRCETYVSKQGFHRLLRF